MNKKIISYISYGTLILGAAIGVYVLADIYYLKSRLPAGACPITNNKLFIYIAIALCVISFILSFFEPKSEHKRGHK